MPKYVPRKDIPNLTEAEWNRIHTLLERDVANFQLDLGNPITCNGASILLPAAERLANKFPSREDQW